MYNLNTKRAVVQEGGAVEWISGSFGSHVGYLYPMSILAGRKSTSSFTGITFACSIVRVPIIRWPLPFLA